MELGGAEGQEQALGTGQGHGYMGTGEEATHAITPTKELKQSGYFKDKDKDKKEEQ